MAMLLIRAVKERTRGFYCAIFFTPTRHLVFKELSGSDESTFRKEDCLKQCAPNSGNRPVKLPCNIIYTVLNVWFQNRRTKWRKKHAAEMASAKKKQEQVEDMESTSDIDDDNTNDGCKTDCNSYLGPGDL
ncbi:hypothetical protein BaRGS_00020038 [Batillaria attramentaria]|uniref:Homeobox domain-containing protein n=1 Tax=Batillaria attramentaria TaxID=370345 RepID=A0ABD0KNC7_9CAEN